VTYVDLDANDFRVVQIRLDNGRWAAGTLEAYRGSPSEAKASLRGLSTG